MLRFVLCNIFFALNLSRPSFKLSTIKRRHLKFFNTPTENSKREPIFFFLKNSVFLFSAISDFGEEAELPKRPHWSWFEVLGHGVLELNSSADIGPG